MNRVWKCLVASTVSCGLPLMGVTGMGVTVVVVTATVTGLGLSGSAWGEESEDWTYWRGPEFNGIARATGLIDDWNPQGGEGSNVAWVRDDLGGRSSPTVMAGKLYTIVRAERGTPREGERVVCVDADTGETLWEHRFNVYLSDVPDVRVGWSSCVADPKSGHVFAQGVCGLFLCLDANTGEQIWSVPLHERFGLLSTYGGRTNFPIVFEDLVIVSGIIIGWGDQAKPCHRFIAFDKATGDVVWFRGTRELPYDTNYSAPTITPIGGQMAIVVGSGDGSVWALQPRTGEKIWNFRFSRRGLNVPPLVVGDQIYASHSEENIEGTEMGAVAAIDGTGTGDISDSGALWMIKEMMAGKAAPLAIDDRLYVFDDRAKLHVLDRKTGARVGRRTALGTMMRASPLYADGKIYAITANGRWFIMQPDADRGVRILKKGRLIAGDECQASPICAGGKIYLQTTGRLYCLRDPEKDAPDYTPKPLPAEAPLTDRTPAHLQLVPAELLLRPGQKQRFAAKLYNAAGQYLKETDTQLSVEGPGEISPSGEFVAPDGHVATSVVAEAAGLTARARIRVVPPLPWNFDFDDIEIPQKGRAGEPPITWVGCRYRHVIRDEDGNGVLVKVTTIPKGTRSRCWFGQSDLSNYTITANVRGAITDGKMPDIGLIAQGYALDLQGANQKVEIRTWVPQRRIAVAVDFEWKPDVWYTMKLMAATQGENVVLRGKVWPRGETEPSDWTVQAEDPFPIRSGSPGLFGNAKDSEIFLDNIHVAKNN
jgi:outer membrane protein assembly factor BamB